MFRIRFILRLLMLVLMIFGGRDRCCPVHCASSIIRYQGDVKRAETRTHSLRLLIRLF